jgi:hypothetical protein
MGISIHQRIDGFLSPEYGRTIPTHGTYFHRFKAAFAISYNQLSTMPGSNLRVD